MANLRDVALLAGVHVSTVSKVLRNDPSQKARTATRERILAAAEQLKYRPNSIARSLRTNRTHTLALLVPDLDNISLTQIFRGALVAAEEAGYLVVLVDAHDAVSHEEIYLRLVSEGRVDGLLVAFAHIEDQLAARLAEYRVPVVLVNRRARGLAGSVVFDDARAAALAVEYLVNLGHRYIGHVSGPLDTDTGLRRRDGFFRAVTDNGLHIPDAWVQESCYTEESGYAAARRIVEVSDGHRPTALYAANLMSALGTLRAICDLGLHVPDDVSVIAMDDHIIAGHIGPPLTTVATPLREMGSQAIRMLIEAIEGKPVHHLIMDEAARIVVRASTAPPHGA